MCGIFGSNDREQFLTLYKLNHSRGSYSFGYYSFNCNTDNIFWTNRQNIDKSDLPSNALYYLGHVRSPTSSTNEFKTSQCHPFVCDSVVYAHNGIISNTEELEKEYKQSYDVDSKWIGHLYNINSQKQTLFVDILQKIKGTYALWFLNKNTKQITLARSANPIYYSLEYNSFSSTQFNNSELLKEGVLYVGDIKQIQKTGTTFNFKSPYFIPG